MAVSGRFAHLACLLFLLSASLAPLCSGQCQTAGRFGEDCQYQCHCQQTCDVSTGRCPANCTDGYEGPTCQKRNVAHGKTATASSTRPHDGWTADKAVDGDTRQDVGTGTCFHSAAGGMFAWWSVDLGAVFPMDNIVIYYRNGTISRFVNASILVSNSTDSEVRCATVRQGDADSNAVLRFSCPTSGSKLIIRHDEGVCGECILELCEVQVFVCTNGTYGVNCAEECGHCSDNATCHHVTGSCLSGGCQPGYIGDRCDQVISENGDDWNGAVVGAAVAATLVVLVLIILVLVLWLRRRSGGGGPHCPPIKKLTPKFVRNGDKKAGGSEGHRNPAFQQDSSTPTLSAGSQVEREPPSDGVMPRVTALPGAAEVKLSACMDTAKLGKVVASKKAKGTFEKEFEAVPDSFLADYSVSQQEEHAPKNKFRGYFPYDFNRVVLEPTQADPNSHYINASFINGFKKDKMYIASQAPTPVTLPDFLRMIWQQKCSHVVMLTNLVENIKVKCVRYWPEAEGEELKCGEVTVTLTQRTQWSYCTLRQLTLNHQSGGSLTVKQFHFTTWPDHGVPSHVDMLDFFWKVRAFWTPDSGTLLVHCSAGVGRTGTFVALCILSDQAASQQRVDPLATLTALRHQRRNMIQTLPQYEFLHEALVRVVQLGRTAMDTEDFCSRFPSERGGLLVGNRTLDQLAQDIPKMCDLSKNNASEWATYSNSTDWDYFQNSRHISVTAAGRGFELLKLGESGAKVLAPPGLWNFLLGTGACALVDLHSQQSLVCEGKEQQQQQQEKGDIRVDWRQPSSLESGLTSRPLTLRSSQSKPGVEVEYIALDLAKAEMPGCVASLASRLSTIQLATSSPIVLLYRASEERCAQLLCAAVNLAESLRLDGHVELVSSLLRLQTPLDPEEVKRLAEVAYAILRDFTSVYANT